MRKMLWIAAVVALAFAVGFPLVRGRAADPKKDTQELMQRKLQKAQKVLEGIALNDFEKIAKNADDLIDISKRAEWKVLDNPKYELFSNEFRRRADQLGKNAREKNLDGATLAYMEMTMTCVRCHKHVREERRTEIPLTGDDKVAAE